ncbi:MAG: NAD-dependent epimerase/dehydratase family protein [Patescibacteria group bacterium]
MAKILVTGGAGFIGSNCCNILTAKGHDVTAFDNLFLGKKENLTEAVKFVKGSVLNRDDLEKAGTDFDYIVHLAAASSAPMFEEDLKGSFENNIVGHISVLDFAKDTGVKKVVFASTSSIYGNNPTPLTEDQEVTPPNFYAVTKHAQEESSRAYNKRYGLEIIAFRFMSIYGLNEDHKGNFANLVSQFIWMMEKGERPTLYGDGTQERDFTNVKDVVQGIERAILNDKKYGFTVFNIGTNSSINLIQLVEIINKVTGKNIEPELIPNPVKEGYIKNQLGDLTKISKELGYIPTVTLEDGIKEIYDRLQERKQTDTAPEVAMA